MRTCNTYPLVFGFSKLLVICVKWIGKKIFRRIVCLYDQTFLTRSLVLGRPLVMSLIASLIMFCSFSAKISKPNAACHLCVYGCI